METPESAEVDLGAEPTDDDPFADVESDLPEGVEEGVLGGENPSEAPLVEPEEEPLDGFMEDPEPEDPDESDLPPADPEPEPVAEPTPEPEPEPEPEADPEPATEVEGSDSSETEAPVPDPEPDPEPEAAKPDDFRGYIMLQPGDEPGTWVEVYPRDGRKPDDPKALQARSGKGAVRKTFRYLQDEEGENEFTLVAVPAKMFQVRKVRGEVVDMTAIRVD